MFFADDVPLLVCFTLATIKANGDCHQNRVRVGAGDAVGTRRAPPEHDFPGGSEATAHARSLMKQPALARDSAPGKLMLAQLTPLNDCMEHAQ
jgi:hypothetical protein